MPEPQTMGYRLLIPDRPARLLRHDTSTAIATGGEHGTMGWVVNLWRGVLLCYVLRDKPSARGVPLLLQLELVTCNNGDGEKR